MAYTKDFKWLSIIELKCFGILIPAKAHMKWNKNQWKWYRRWLK